MKHLFYFFISILVLTGCLSETKEPNRTDSTGEDTSEVTETENNNTESRFIGMSTRDWKVEELADNLHYPWDIKVMDNFIVIPEVVGTIAVMEDGQLKRYDVQTSDPIVQEGEVAYSA